jgi:hypothetical protein
LLAVKKSLRRPQRLLLNPLRRLNPQRLRRSLLHPLLKPHPLPMPLLLWRTPLRLHLLPTLLLPPKRRSKFHASRHSQKSRLNSRLFLRPQD